MRYDPTPARYRPTRAEVSLENIRKNIQLIRRTMRSSPLVMAVVKSNGYGHGDVETAQAALEAGAERLGVALVEEGESLRKAGIDAPIHLLFEPPPVAASRVLELELIPTVYTREFAESLASAAERAKNKCKVHLKIDTGMHRVGVFPHQASEMAKFLGNLPSLEVEGIYTHFAMASDPRSPYTARQLGLFMETVEKLRKEGHEFEIKHAAATGAALFLPESELDMVRLGIGIYGLYPGERFQEIISLYPAMELKSELCQVFRLSAGEGISYGFTACLEKDSYIGVVPLGYGDGLTRRLSNRMEVLIGGKRYPQVGTICMDLTMVNLGEDQRSVGEEVVVIGKSGDDFISAEEVAERADTINYEVVCSVGPRVPRIYKN